MRGNAGSAPLKVLDEKGLATGGKRWRFIPLSKRLENTSARPASLPTQDFDANLTDIPPDDTTFSHFETTLSAEADTNITATYNKYYQSVAPFSVSLPLVYRNRKKLLDETLLALETSTRSRAEATPAISKCLAALSRDLGPNVFYPFFAQVVKAIAHVFTTDREKQQNKGNAAFSPSDQSVMWDPETSIVPLFATLAELTKMLLKQLSSDPQKTCEDLFPLLSNQNRRVREMTAEACVGYLVRKTRDSDQLKDLTDALVEGAELPATSGLPEGNLVDGLGASLFEALRVPNGRLQSRASEVVKYAIRSLGVYNGHDEIVPGKENIKLSVVTRCFRHVTRHLTNEEDALALCEWLIREGEAAIRTNNVWRTGGILFLLRNWMRSMGHSFSATIGEQTLRIIYSFLSECLTTFSDDSRVVYEAFGAILVLALNDLSGYRHEALGEFTSALELESKCFGRNGFLAVLSVILFTPNVDFTTMPVPLLLKSLSGFYERLTQMFMPSNLEIPVLASILVFRRVRKVGLEELSLSEFKVPSLQNVIREILANLNIRDGNVKASKDSRGPITEKNMVVEYLCYIRVPGIGDLFSNLLNSCETWTSPGFPAILTAFCRNFAEGKDGLDETSRCSSELHKRITALVKDALFSESLQSASLLEALLRHVHAFPSTIREWLREDQKKVETLFSFLSDGLSSRSMDVRQHSASLLSSLHSFSSHDSGNLNLSLRPIGDVGDIVEQLRFTPDRTSARSVHGMYDSFALLLSVPNSLEAIAKNERVLRELVRASRSRSLHDSMVQTLISFSVGLLRTPLRVLWDGAKDLWCAMASIDRTSAMRIALEYMAECQSAVLSVMNNLSSEHGGIHPPSSGTEVPPPEGNEIDAELSYSKSSYHSLAHLPRKGDMQSCTGSKQEVCSLPKSSHKHYHHSQLPEWDPLEWQSHDIRQALRNQFESQAQRCSENQERVDCVTSLVQLLKVLSEEPQYALQNRSRIIRSFLAFSSDSQDGKGISHVLCTFTVLLERMGGLKCCETDLRLESRLRDCLLANLTKTHIPLQTATVRCLCISRSPFLKPHRDSFIRLLSDKTFREELTMLTESLFQDHTGSGSTANFGEEERNVCDVLTRISFSKIRGKQNKLDSKRSAVLSFLVTKVPWELAMPMITSLTLAPIEAGGSLNIPEAKDVNCSFLSPSVQKGILFSIEAIVKHCRRAIPEESWRRLVCGTNFLLRNSARGSMGQVVRSRALVILADMLKARSGDSEFLIPEVLQAVRKSEFDRTEYTGRTGVPALMYFADAVMSSASKECRLSLLKEHTWALKYCIQAMKNAAAGLKAVSISLSVGHGLAETLAQVSCREDRMALSAGLPWTTDLLDFTCSAMREFFSWITECLIHTKASQKTWSPVFAKALALTTILANLSLPQSQFKALYPLAEGLCAFLETGVGVAESRTKALSALRSIVSNTTREGFISGLKEMQEVENLVVRLLPLLNTRDVTDNREAISALCCIIAKSPYLDTAAAGTILQSVNAFDSSRLNEPDFDRRIEGLRIISESIKNALSTLHKTGDETAADITLPSRQDDVGKKVVVSCGANAFSALLYGCLSAVRADDTAVRGTAGYSLSLMAQWVANSNEVRRSSRSKMFTILISTVATCKTLSVRREYCRSLGELVRLGRCNSCSFSGLDENAALDWNAEAMFSVISGLGNADDLDADFFENLVHLQPHRRGRALRHLAKHMKELFSTASQQDTDRRKAVETLAFCFALPLGLNMALEIPCNAKPRSSHFGKHTESREGAQKDVSNWAVELVGVSAALLPWPPYRSFLSSLLRKLKVEGDGESLNMLLKLLVGTSKVFPRPDDMRGLPLEESICFLTSKIIPEMLTHINPSAVEGNILAPNIPKFRSSKTSRTDKDSPTFRAPIAIAVGELMTCLPEQKRDSHISLLIAPLSGALRSRTSGPREEAKKALTAVVLILGPKYLNYVLSQVLNALKNGFRRDACVYVIYTVLAGIHNFRKGSSEDAVQRKSFPVDSCCDVLVSFLIQELEDGLGESKRDFADPNTSSERERHASLRALKAFECVKLLAEQIRFEDSATNLINPFLHSHKRATSAKLLKKMRSALKHLVQGFARNPLLQAEHALKICYAYAHWEGLTRDEAKPNEVADDTSGIDCQDCNGIESVNFSLELLNVVLARNNEIMKGTDERGRVLQSMCEPFLSLVVKALTIGNDEVTLTAFRTCQRLLKLPLCGRAQVADKLSETVVDVLAARSAGVSSGGNGSSGDDLFNTCLRAGAVLLQELGPRGFEAISKERVEALVNISCNCLEHGCMDSRSAGVALLRAVVSRRLMMPCVYDAMETVKQMGIFSHSGPLRRSCISLCVGFLVCFPLGSKRVRQNIEFFVRNLNYSEANGRLAALQALKMIISKFPSEVLEGESEYLFVALTAAGARDTDGECRNGAIECMKELFQKWGRGRQTIEMVRMGTTLAGVELCAGSESDEDWKDWKYRGGTDTVVQRAGILGLTAAGLSGQVKKRDLRMIGRVAMMVLKEEGRECGWETKYSVLRCVEACVRSTENEEGELEVDEKMFWLWQEMASLLVDKHEWVRTCACRLLGWHLSAVERRQKTKNISEWKTEKGWIWSRYDIVRDTMKSLCLELEASHVSMEIAEQAVKNLVRVGDGVRRFEDGNTLLRWLLTRMSGIASRGGTEKVDLLRRACGLRFLIVTVTRWGKWVMDSFGGLYIRPVVQVLERHEQDTNVKRLGQELQEIVIKIISAETYYFEYDKFNTGRKRVRASRNSNGKHSKRPRKN